MKVRLIDAALLECETEGTCVKVPLRRSRKQSRLQADHDDLVARVKTALDELFAVRRQLDQTLTALAGGTHEKETSRDGETDRQENNEVKAQAETETWNQQCGSQTQETPPPDSVGQEVEQIVEEDRKLVPGLTDPQVVEYHGFKETATEVRDEAGDASSDAGEIQGEKDHVPQVDTQEELRRPRTCSQSTLKLVKKGIGSDLRRHLMEVRSIFKPSIVCTESGRVGLHVGNCFHGHLPAPPKLPPSFITRALEAPKNIISLSGSTSVDTWHYKQPRLTRVVADDVYDALCVEDGSCAWELLERFVDVMASVCWPSQLSVGACTTFRCTACKRLPRYYSHACTQTDAEHKSACPATHGCTAPHTCMPPEKRVIPAFSNRHLKRWVSNLQYIAPSWNAFKSRFEQCVSVSHGDVEKSLRKFLTPRVLVSMGPRTIGAIILARDENIGNPYGSTGKCPEEKCVDGSREKCMDFSTETCVNAPTQESAQNCAQPVIAFSMIEREVPETLKVPPTPLSVSHPDHVRVNAIVLQILEYLKSLEDVDEMETSVGETRRAEMETRKDDADKWRDVSKNDYFFLNLFELYDQLAF